MDKIQIHSHSTFEAKEILQVDYMRLNEWLKFVPPTQKAEGRGTRAKLSTGDLYRLKLFSILVGYGVKREFAAQLVILTNNIKAEDFERSFLCVGMGAGADLGIADISKDKPIDLFKSGDPVSEALGIKSPLGSMLVSQITVNLSAVKRMVDRELKLK